jgi:hypothetical protein
MRLAGPLGAIQMNALHILRFKMLVVLASYPDDYSLGMECLAKRQKARS